MRLDLEFMQLHEPLFLDGVNFGLRLEPKSAKGHLNLNYDTELQLGLVTFRGKVAIVPNIANATVANPHQLGIQTIEEIKIAPVVAINPHVRAQVSGPEKPVQTFPTQVSDPTKVVRRPGRPPRFQGEETQGE